MCMQQLLLLSASLARVHLLTLMMRGASKHICCYSHMTVDCGLLQQRVVSARKHCLCFGQSINFTCASRLAGIEVRKQPVAICMCFGKELMCGHGLLCCGCLLILILQKLCLKIGLGALLVCDCL